ncbi:MAG TPA: sulfotransferase [Myxococcota bacterium]|nr:sulfotransferase [Myxococcota bacterium]
MKTAVAAPPVRHVRPFRDASRTRPLWMRGLNRLARLAPGWPSLAAADLWRAAGAERSGIGPTPAACEALERLCDALAATGRLHGIGRIAARDDTIRLARTHLRIRRALAATPAILDARLPPLVFVVGWPRTGSTALHALLAADPRHRSVPYWESFDPVPPERGPDRRIEGLERMLAQLERFSPDYHAIHPMSAEGAEECVALFMNHFRTLQFDFQYRVPDYVAWLLAQDAGIAYADYHDSLRLIQHHRPHGERFVLKDPTHLVHLETLLARFPDARIVFTHRDPVTAISSLCSLYAHTRAIFSDDVDPRAIGAEVMTGYWPRALEAAQAIRARLEPGRFVDVRQVDLRRDPLAAVERIYTRLFGEGPDAAGRAAMERHLAAKDAAPRDRHEHDLADFGIDADAVRERFRAYREAFDFTD